MDDFWPSCRSNKSLHLFKVSIGFRINRFKDKFWLLTCIAVHNNVENENDKNESVEIHACVLVENTSESTNEYELQRVQVVWRIADANETLLYCVWFSFPSFLWCADSITISRHNKNFDPFRRYWMRCYIKQNKNYFLFDCHSKS